MISKLKKLMRQKRGVFENLQDPVVSLAVVGMVIVVALLIMAQARTQDVSITGTACNGSSGSIGCNATKAIQSSMNDFTTWFAIIVVVIIGVFLIALVKKINA